MENSKEKQIEEMAKMLSEDCGSCENCKALGATADGVDCTDYYYAQKLYNAGYRKPTDLAEEIFAEIERLLRENQFTLLPPYRSEITDWKTVFRLKLAGDIAELKKKYTEEGK